METQMDLKKAGLYLLIPVIVCLILFIEKSTFVLIGLVQFFVGVVQVFIAFIKTLYCFGRKEPFPMVLKYYWLMVLVYFVIGFFGGIVMNYLEIENDLYFDIAMVYLSLAWVIAVYSFKHILFKIL